MKKIIIFLLMFFIAHGVWAQVNIDVPLPKSLRTVSSKENPKRKVKFTTGGSVGVQIGTLMGLQVQPKFGILPCNWLAIGVTGTYIFRWNVVIREVSHTFGVSPYVEAYLFKNQLVLHAEYEYLNFPVVEYDKNYNEVRKFRSSSHVVLVGGGYNRQLSDHSSISAIILLPVYQYNSDKINYYSSWYTPVVRIGYSYSF